MTALSHQLLLPFRRERAGLALLAVAGAVLLFAGSARSLLTPYDDAFFADAAKRLAQDGRWLDLRTREGPLQEKPPLAIWLEAISIRALGPTTFAARLPGMLVAWGGLLGAYALLRRRDGHRAALLGCLILLTTQQFIFYARRPVTEIYLTVWTMLALLCWRLGAGSPGGGPEREVERGRAGRPERLSLPLAGLFIGLAIMTKGLAGLLPCLVIGLHVALTRSWDVARRPAFWAMALVALAVAVPWHAAMIARRGAEFTRVYFWGRQLSFATRPGSDMMPGDALTIVRKIAENWWPWLLAFVPALAAAAVQGWRSRRSPGDRRGSWPLLLVIWFGAILLVFQLAHVKRHQYVMPAYPAMAFLCAWGILRWRHAERALIGTTLFVLAAMAVALVTPLWPRAMDNNLYGSKLGAVRYLAAHPELTGTLLVLDRDEGYCFTCDTAGYYTALAAEDYSAERLARALAPGAPLYVLVDAALTPRLAADLPPGAGLRTLVQDREVSLVSVVAGEPSPR